MTCSACPKRLNKQNTTGFCGPCHVRHRRDLPEVKAYFADYARGWRARNTHRRQELNRKSWLSKKYKLTPDQYAVMLAEQNNRCGLCRLEFTSLPHIDHDHQTGYIRRILCIRCNTMLGQVERIGLSAIAQYLTTEWPMSGLTPIQKELQCQVLA